MKLSQAKKLFRQYLQDYFSGADVIFSRQSRVAKSALPLVSITTGNVNRHQNPVYKMVDGYLVGHYLSRISITIDLFTHGEPVIDDETGAIIAYENTALDDILDLADFLGSPYTIEWCQKNDFSILIDGEAQDLTGLVNDNNYEYRSRLNVLFYFTQRTVGSVAVLDEDSILYPEGAGGYTSEEPAPTTSSTGRYKNNEDDGSIIVPSFSGNSSGGGSKELAEKDAGYFTEVEIKEETGNE